MLFLFGLATASWIWFCSITLIASILLLILIESNQPAPAAFTLIVASILLKCLAGVDLFKAAWQHPGIAILIAIGYFVAGTLWSVGKWYLFVKSRRAKYDEARAAWELLPISARRHGSGSKRDNALGCEKWEQSDVYARFSNYGSGLAPLVRDNKKRVLIWMCYWPWSMIWTVINDPIKKAFKAIYNRIHNYLQTISNNAFKDAK